MDTRTTWTASGAVPSQFKKWNWSELKQSASSASEKTTTRRSFVLRLTWENLNKSASYFCLESHYNSSILTKLTTTKLFQTIYTVIFMNHIHKLWPNCQFERMLVTFETIDSCKCFKSSEHVFLAWHRKHMCLIVCINVFVEIRI